MSETAPVLAEVIEARRVYRDDGSKANYARLEEAVGGEQFALAYSEKLIVAAVLRGELVPVGARIEPGNGREVWMCTKCGQTRTFYSSDLGYPDAGFPSCDCISPPTVRKVISGPMVPVAVFRLAEEADRGE